LALVRKNARQFIVLRAERRKLPAPQGLGDRGADGVWILSPRVNRERIAFMWTKFPTFASRSVPGATNYPAKAAFFAVAGGPGFLSASGRA
jgi:hypothetical protein